LIFAQSSDQLQKVKDALTSGQVTAWDVLAAVVIVGLSIPVSKLVRRYTAKALKRVANMPETAAVQGGRAAGWIVTIIAVGWALSLIGAGIGWVAIIVIIVLIIGLLMAKPMIENSAAGMLLTLRPVYAVGDQIDTLGYEGTVTKIGSRTTVLKTSNGKEVHAPNVQVLKEPIVVYTATSSRKAEFDIIVAFDTDLDKLTAVTLDAIAGVDSVVKDPAPAVQASGFHYNTITVTISYWYPSDMSSGSTPTDGVIRAVTKAISASSVKLAVPKFDIKGATSTSSEADASTPKSGGTTDDSSSDAGASSDSAS